MQFSGYYNGAYPELLYSGGYVAMQRDRVCALDRDDRIFAILTL